MSQAIPVRSEQSIREARSYIVRTLMNPKLDDEQRVLLMGMSTALQWVCGEGGSSLQRLLEGEPIATK